MKNLINQIKTLPHDVLTGTKLGAHSHIPFELHTKLSPHGIEPV